MYGTGQDGASWYLERHEYLYDFLSCHHQHSHLGPQVSGDTKLHAERIEAVLAHEVDSLSGWYLRESRKIG